MSGLNYNRRTAITDKFDYAPLCKTKRKRKSKSKTIFKHCEVEVIRLKTIKPKKLRLKKIKRTPTEITKPKVILRKRHSNKK